MPRTPSPIPALILSVLLTGCGPGASESSSVRQNLVEAQRREADAIQRSEQTAEDARQERRRREFWQATAFASALAAVVLLIVGVAVGSRSKTHDPDVHL